jgi:hypothetical protein
MAHDSRRYWSIVNFEFEGLDPSISASSNSNNGLHTEMNLLSLFVVFEPLCLNIFSIAFISLRTESIVSGAVAISPDNNVNDPNVSDIETT